MLQFIHSPIEEDLECLHLLAIINKTNINLTMQAFVWTHILKLIGWTPRSTISGWYGKMMISLFKNCQTIFEVAYHLHSHSNECCCSTPLPATNFVSFFYFILFYRCVVVCPFIFNTSFCAHISHNFNLTLKYYLTILLLVSLQSINTNFINNMENSYNMQFCDLLKRIWVYIYLCLCWYKAVIIFSSLT